MTCYQDATVPAAFINVPEAVTAVAAGADSVLAILKGMRGDSRFVAALVALEEGRWCVGAGWGVGDSAGLIHGDLVALSRTDWLPASDLQCIAELLSGSPSGVSHWSSVSVPGLCLTPPTYRQLAAVLLIRLRVPDMCKSWTAVTALFCIHICNVSTGIQICLPASQHCLCHRRRLPMLLS